MGEGTFFERVLVSKDGSLVPVEISAQTPSLTNSSRPQASCETTVPVGAAVQSRREAPGRAEAISVRCAMHDVPATKNPLRSITTYSFRMSGSCFGRSARETSPCLGRLEG